MLLFLIIPTIVLAASAACEPISADYPRTIEICEVLVDIQWILYAGAMALAVIMIIIGGIKYVTAGENEDQVKSARKTIINGLIGAAIVFAAGFMFSLVKEFITTKFK